MQIVETLPQPAARDLARRRIGRPVYSIVAPVWNEQALITEFYQRAITVMEPLGEPFELVLVNDGSTDRSTEIMRQLNAQDSRVKVVNFSKNFGHQIAITAGI